jgi:site-specific DNA-methyltransferase (adenine-specific)
LGCDGRTGEVSTVGRWPANVIHDGSDEVEAAFAVFGNRSTSKPGSVFKKSSAAENKGNVGAAYGSESRPAGSEMIAYGDTGTASRFFYCAKASKSERIGSKHPTVKPLDLIQYLVRLITPPGGTVLDPFSGTGTTGEAAFREGMRAILIEREPEYQADIARRMQLVLAGPDEKRRSTIKARGQTESAGPLFAEAAE